MITENSITWQEALYVYVIWMWIDLYRKYQPAEPEYEACGREREANKSQVSYSVEQADFFSINHISLNQT